MTPPVAPALMRAVVAAALLGVMGSGAWAQSPLPAPSGTAEPAVKRTVIEDDQNRIEEVRVRGQVTSVTVQPRRAGAPAYRILPAEGGRDLSREGVPPGQRVWSVLSF